MSTASAPLPAYAPSSYDYKAAVEERTCAAIRLSHRNSPRAEPLSDRDCLLVVRALVRVALERPHGQSWSRNEAWLAHLLSASPADLAGSEGILSLATRHGPKFRGRFLRSSPSSPAESGYLPAVPRIVEEATAPAPVVAARLAELVAHLHALATPSPVAFMSPSIRTRAKEIVYTRANWTRHSGYGPFQSDGSGRVDWRKVEALAIVAGANLADGRAMGWGRPPRTTTPAAPPAHLRGSGATASSSASRGPEVGPAIPPRGWASSRPLSAGPVRADPEGRDWSGLTTHELVGSYMFLHYPTFLAFQSPYSPPPLGDEDEAVGDCLPMVFELLPEGEWPAEIEHPDLSIEAQDLAEEDDDEDDRDWSGGSDSEEADDEDESLYDERDDVDDSADLAARVYHVQQGSSTSPAGTLPSANPSSQSVRPGLAHYEYNPTAHVSGMTSPSASASVGTSSGYNLAFSSLSSSVAAGSAPLPAVAATASSGADFLTYIPLHPGQSPGRSAPPALELEHLVPPDGVPTALPSTRLCPPPGALPHPTHPTLAFRGVPGSLRYTDPGQPIPALRPGIEELYHAEARTFRGTIEWLPEDGVAKVSFIVRYAGEDQWLLYVFHCDLLLHFPCRVLRRARYFRSQSMPFRGIHVVQDWSSAWRSWITHRLRRRLDECRPFAGESERSVHVSSYDVRLRSPKRKSSRLSELPLQVLAACTARGNLMRRRNTSCELFP